MVPTTEQQVATPARPGADGRTSLRILIPLVALAGAVGAILRLTVGELVPEAGMKFPWTTLTVNLSGSGLLGVLLGVVAARPYAPSWVVPTLGTGLLGSYTTFSSVILAVMPSWPGKTYDGLTGVTYVSPGVMEMLAYLGLSVLGCTAAAAAGLTIGSAIFGCVGHDCAERQRTGRPGGDVA